jgi:hypothetical protein
MGDWRDTDARKELRETHPVFSTDERKDRIESL